MSITRVKGEVSHGGKHNKRHHDWSDSNKSWSDKDCDD
jgi:hypothetical protein